MVLWISRHVFELFLNWTFEVKINLFKVKVQPEAIQYIWEKFAPADDPVFKLVPPVFTHHVGQVYAEIGSPQLKAGNIWQVYHDMVECLEHIATCGPNMDDDYIDSLDCFEVLSHLEDQDMEAEADAFYPLIEGRELQGGIDHPRKDGSIYLGGVNGGKGLGMLYKSLKLIF